MPEEKTAHGKFGYATCVPNERMDGGDPFWEHVGFGMIGLIPLKIWELRNASDAELMGLAKEASDAIGSRGDRFQFPKGKEPSGVLAELAKGFAAAARLADGGITGLGVHACFFEHEGCPKNRDR